MYLICLNKFIFNTEKYHIHRYSSYKKNLSVLLVSMYESTEPKYKYSSIKEHNNFEVVSLKWDIIRIDKVFLWSTEIIRRYFQRDFRLINYF